MWWGGSGRGGIRSGWRIGVLLHINKSMFFWDGVEDCYSDLEGVGGIVPMTMTVQSL